MTFASLTVDGPAVRAGSSSLCASGPDRSQAAARRHAVWLNALEVGLFDPIADRVRPYSAPEIARLFGVTVRAVQSGLAAARAARSAIEAAG